jgi:UDP-N-acetylglucosamine--N-acetylmuramyl-(pentapeptide) pyrophosphoryl-undecaprenol N-acetylglucosamine transferase
VTGRPIPAVSRVTLTKEEARDRFFFAQEPVLLVVGGSQGARSLNELAVESFGAAGPQVLHASGERDFQALAARVGRPGYRLLPFVPDYGVALAAADLVIARAGGSVWELAAAGLPAILVPYPFATADHQMRNARYFERTGGAILVEESELGHVPELARSLLGDPTRLEQMSAAMARVARPDAAEQIAQELFALAAAGR